MPKRKYSDDKEEKWRRKIRRYEEKILKKSRDHVFSRADDEEFCDESPPPLSGSPQSPRALASIVTPCVTNMSEVDTGQADPVPAQAVTEVSPVEPAPTYTEVNLVSEAEHESADVPPTDPELLLALGTFDEELNEWGPDISEDLAKRWEPILKNGLKNDAIEDISKKILFPKNCPSVKPPVLNPEISTMLNENARNRDVRIVKKQSHLACALTVLGETMTNMLTRSIDTPAILRNLSDATKIIAHAHYSETETRRSLVTPMVDKSFIEPFKHRKRDSHLFGDKLSDFIKTSCGIQKTSKLIQSTTSGSLNSKAPPPPRAAAPYRGQRPQTRGGGVRAAHAFRRRPTGYHAAAQGRARRAPTPPMPPSATQRHKQPDSFKRKL